LNLDLQFNQVEKKKQIINSKSHLILA